MASAPPVPTDSAAAKPRAVAAIEAPHRPASSTESDALMDMAVVVIEAVDAGIARAKMARD